MHRLGSDKEHWGGEGAAGVAGQIEKGLVCLVGKLGL